MSVCGQIDRDRLNLGKIEPLEHPGEHVQLRSQRMQQQDRPARTRAQVPQFSPTDAQLGARGPKSLYQEFGSKHELLDAALTCYADDIVATLLADLSEPDAGLEAIGALFLRLARLFRTATRPAESGCLLVNTIAELATRDDRVLPAAVRYRDRLRSSFRAALASASERGDVDAASVQPRADLLAATLVGVWLTVRIDPHDASRLCETIAAQTGWRPYSRCRMGMSASVGPLTRGARAIPQGCS
jgi:TetR/AcrR family transcriptional regulator, transcriptional repressor for nem operon